MTQQTWNSMKGRHWMITIVIIVVGFLAFTWLRCLTNNEISIAQVEAPDPPKFEDYEIELCQEFEKVERPNLSDLPETDYVFKTVELQWDLEEQVFACNFLIVEWGCGTSCQVVAIFNQETGDLIETYNTSISCEFKPNSRLLRLVGDPYFDFEDQYLVIMDNGEMHQLDWP